MPNFQSAFPSKYLKAANFEDGDKTMTVREIKMETLGQGAKAESKLVCYFENEPLGLVLNMTNCKAISKIAGTENYDKWPGAVVRLTAVEVEFQGDPVMSIRVREPKKLGKPTLDKAKAAPVEAPDDDSIPF